MKFNETIRKICFFNTLLWFNWLWYNAHKNSRGAYIVKNIIKISRLLLMISFIIVFVSGCNSNEIKETSIEEEQGNSVSKKMEETINDEDISIEDEKSKIETTENNKEKLTFDSEYRYKNSYERIKIVFSSVELISDYNGILPEREAFLIFHLKYSAPFLSKTTLINLPSIITGPNVSYIKLIGNNETKEFKEYKSLNNFNSPYIEKDDGLKYDLVTQINYDLGYVDLPEPNKKGYISAYNIDFIEANGESDGFERALIFDINKNDALNPENYLVYDPHAKPGEEVEHPEEKIYFSQFIEDKTK